MNAKYLCSMFLALATCWSLTGCQTVHWSKGDWESGSYFKRKPKEPKTEFGVPVEMTAIWADAVYRVPNEPASRGFGGRFYFFDSEHRPIKVDGEVSVFGYDDTITDGAHTRADKKFVFRKQDLQSHFSETDLGPSYSFWIPWEDLGGEPRQIALIPYFEDDKGNIIKGVMNVNLLPGRKSEADALMLNPPANTNSIATTQADGKSVVYMGTENETESTNKMKVTTLDIPENVIFRQASVEATAPPMVFNEIQKAQKQLESNVGPPPPPNTPSDSGTTGFPSTAASDPSAAKPAERTSRSVYGMPGSFR